MGQDLPCPLHVPESCWHDLEHVATSFARHCRAAQRTSNIGNGLGGHQQQEQEQEQEEQQEEEKKKREEGEQEEEKKKGEEGEKEEQHDKQDRVVLDAWFMHTAGTMHQLPHFQLGTVSLLCCCCCCR